MTAAQRRVLALVAEGLSNREIARQLVCEQKTIENHLNAIYHEMGLEDRTSYAPRVRATLAYFESMGYHQGGA